MKLKSISAKLNEYAGREIMFPCDSNIFFALLSLHVVPCYHGYIGRVFFRFIGYHPLYFLLMEMKFAFIAT